MISIFLSKHKLRSGVCVAEKVLHLGADPLAGSVPKLPAQYEQTEDELEDQTPHHNHPVDLQCKLQERFDIVGTCGI